MLENEIAGVPVADSLFVGEDTNGHIGRDRRIRGDKFGILAALSDMVPSVLFIIILPILLYASETYDMECNTAFTNLSSGNELFERCM